MQICLKHCLEFDRQMTLLARLSKRSALDAAWVGEEGASSLLATLGEQSKGDASTYIGL